MLHAPFLSSGKLTLAPTTYNLVRWVSIVEASFRTERKAMQSKAKPSWICNMRSSPLAAEFWTFLRLSACSLVLHSPFFAASTGRGALKWPLTSDFFITYYIYIIIMCVFYGKLESPVRTTHPCIHNPFPPKACFHTSKRSFNGVGLLTAPN